MYVINFNTKHVSILLVQELELNEYRHLMVSSLIPISIGQFYLTLILVLYFHTKPVLNMPNKHKQIIIYFTSIY